VIAFLASIIEQMDLALDQLALNDANYQRFALMLVDNAMELTLHRYANDKYNENEMWGKLSEPRHDPKAVATAMGQHFESKVKLARVTGLIDQSACNSIITLHSFRNQIYHRGVCYEKILAALSLFYFKIACDVFEKYSPPWYSWSSGQTITHRARKYLGNKPLNNIQELHVKACQRLKEVSEGMPLRLIEDLSAHMESVIENVDGMINFLSQDGPEKRTREQVIVDCQAWQFAFTEEGKQFARENHCPAKTMAEYIDWISSTYNWPHRSDPIESWQKRLESLKSETDHHEALKKYKDFMDQTEDLREKIDESATQLDRYIQEQIDLARGK
jgi:hypothetical protein